MTASSPTAHVPERTCVACRAKRPQAAFLPAAEGDGGQNSPAPHVQEAHPARPAPLVRAEGGVADPPAGEVELGTHRQEVEAGLREPRAPLALEHGVEPGALDAALSASSGRLRAATSTTLCMNGAGPQV